MVVKRWITEWTQVDQVEKDGETFFVISSNGMEMGRLYPKTLEELEELRNGFYNTCVRSF